jgi:hypothetical protein
MRGLYVVEEQMVFVLVIWVIQVLKEPQEHKEFQGRQVDKVLKDFQERQVLKDL